MINFKYLNNYRLDPLKVKVLQWKKKITNRQIAQDLRVHEATISYAISGQTGNQLLLQAIADYLEVDLMDIVQESDQPEQSAA